MSTTALSSFRRNILGTLDFTAKFGKMRKASEFCVYPMQDSGETIRIQSDNRFGQIDLSTGAGIISANSGGAHAGGAWLTLCQIRGTAERFQLSESDRAALREQVKGTGGVLVGDSFVKCENIGALAL